MGGEGRRYELGFGWGRVDFEERVIRLEFF